MALTPEDVVNKRFTIVKFRDGYDVEEVDDYLDVIVVELRRLNQENQDLKQRLASSESGVSVPAPITDSFPTAAVVAASLPQGSDATNSHSLLELARKLHEEHVREGLTKRDQLIREGQESAARIVRDAESQARSVLAQLELDRKSVENHIQELKQFESDYRVKLRDYIQAQLNTLAADGGAPQPSYSSVTTAANTQTNPQLVNQAAEQSGEEY